MAENPGSAGVVRAAHVALLVSDLDKSVRFYCEGLGFREVARVALGQEIAPVGPFEGETQFEAVIVTRDLMTIELAHWSKPGMVPRAGVNALNDIGYSHVGLMVEDIDKALEALSALGGSVLTGTRTKLEGSEIVFALDPDGTRVEIMRLDQMPFA